MIEDTVLYYLLVVFLVSGTTCFVAISWLVIQSLRAARLMKEGELRAQPEVVLVPVGGPLTPSSAPTRH